MLLCRDWLSTRNNKALLEHMKAEGTRSRYSEKYRPVFGADVILAKDRHSFRAFHLPCFHTQIMLRIWAAEALLPTRLLSLERSPTLLRRILTMTPNPNISRRRFMQVARAASAGLALGPYWGFSTATVIKPLRRDMGRMHFEATTLGLGGQASLQWTPADVDPVKIILKAFDLGINYFDTSNAYGPSQMEFR